MLLAVYLNDLEVASIERRDPLSLEVRDALDQHHRRLRAAPDSLLK